jgi:hypothetical protein
MPKINMRNSILSMLLWCCFLFLILLHYYNFTSYDKGTLFLVLIITLISICCFSFKRDNQNELRGQYLRVSNLFLLGFIIVHFQFYIDLVLGNFDMGRQDLVVSRDIIIKSAVISSIALVCFCLGYFYKLKKNNLKKNNTIDVIKIFDLKGLKILITIFFIGFIGATPVSYYRGGYATIELSQLSLYFQSFLIVSIIGYLILNTRNLFLKKQKAENFFKFIRYNGTLLTLLIGVYCFLVMVSGDRGPILQIGLSYVGCYCILNRKKYNILFIIGATFLAAFIVSFLAYFRHYEGTGNFADMVRQSSEMETDAISNKLSFSPSTFELSRSVRTMHASVLYTESEEHTYGVFQGFQIISIIPGVGQLIMPLFGTNNEMLKSSFFLTNQLDADHGLGTTVVADIWLDFGVLGIILSFYIFGYFLRKIDEYTYSHLPLNIFWYILIAVFLSKAFYIGRGTILVLFRDVVLGYIILLIGIYIIKNSNKSIKIK